MFSSLVHCFSSANADGRDEARKIFVEYKIHHRVLQIIKKLQEGEIKRFDVSNDKYEIIIDLKLDCLANAYQSSVQSQE